MKQLITSPLIRGMTSAVGFSVVLLALSMLLPLPGHGGREKINEHDRDVLIAGSDQDLETAAILERPIFHENRRKPKAIVVQAEPAAPPPPIEAPYVLVGIMGAADSNRTAYLQHKSSGETAAVKAGELVGEWRVDSVGQNFVTVVFGNERRVLQLADGG